MKCGTGGAGVEWLTESAVTISKIKTKALNTAEIILSHRYLSDIKDSE